MGPCNGVGFRTERCGSHIESRRVRSSKLIAAELLFPPRVRTHQASAVRDAATMQLGNCAVLLAAVGVFGTGTGCPDVIVVAIMAVLALQGSVAILRQALDELRTADRSVMAAGYAR